eukprot:TRINITY_DN939_c0_g1_i1.p1 TRINITY_DN939_c0_g1~~TRINITY_DN939_c0_g1_i1.p1  ORF type:complete len:474 (+),score=117.29 TRINITY_DN939_c0_g1_i1:52-1473(+)
MAQRDGGLSSAVASDGEPASVPHVQPPSCAPFVNPCIPSMADSSSVPTVPQSVPIVPQSVPVPEAAKEGFQWPDKKPPGSERSLEDVLTWKPAPDVEERTKDVLSAVQTFERNWAEFQRKFDQLNRALIANIATMVVPEDRTEYEEEAGVVAKKAEEAAGLIRSAKKVMVLTGAGISTSAGICDYRGPQGKWTLKAKGQHAKSKRIDALLPTPGHMAIQRLVEKGWIHKVLSTNVDGLHRMSGIAQDMLTEFHGNAFVERCNACGIMYERPFQVRIPGVKTRRTGGMCTQCSGPLVDSIINFGDKLRTDELRPVQAYAEEQCDLLLVLGTSISVAPVCHLPRLVSKNAQDGKVCIVNKQKTGSDSVATVHCHASTDDFMMGVLQALEGCGPPPPPPPRKQYRLEDILEWRKEQGCLFQGPINGTADKGGVAEDSTASKNSKKTKKKSSTPSPLATARPARAALRPTRIVRAGK